MSRAVLTAVYAELLALRRGAPRPPAERFRAIAAELPGALRILDQLPDDALEARVRELESAATEPWIEATLVWREVMRDALSVRRAAGRERSTEKARAGAARDEVELDAIVRPAGGRLVAWALERVAERVGRPAEDVEREIFGGRGASSLARKRAAESRGRSRR